MIDPLPPPLFILALLFAIAGFFAGAETSLFSLSRFQLRQWKAKAPRTFQKARHLLDRPAALVATVLLGNECANVAVSNIMAKYYQSIHLSPLETTILNLCTAVPLFIFFGEITPKIFAAKTSLATAQFVIRPLWFFYKISFPVRLVIETIVDYLTRGIKKSGHSDDHIDEEDFLHLVEEGRTKGAIHSSEQELIENVFELDDDRVIDIATPISECFTARQEDSAGEVIERLKKDFAPRIPVIGTGPKEVVGILYAKDLLNHLHVEQANTPVKQIMKAPLVVEPGMKAEALFRRFRQTKVHIAISEDHTKNETYVITMEDILEQMFGELWEESE